MKIILADVFITINAIGKEKRVEIAHHNFLVKLSFFYISKKLLPSQLCQSRLTKELALKNKSVQLGK